MSLASKTAASVPSGAVQLFFADAAPAGWQRVSAVRVPSDLYESSPCLTLLNYDSAPGGAALSALTGNSATVNDYTSTEHVYIAQNLSLRRQNLLTGVGTMCPNAPYSLPYSGSNYYALATPHGLFFYSTSATSGLASTGVQRYTAHDSAWTGMANMPEFRSSYGLAYDATRDCAYLAGGTATGGTTAYATVFIHYPARNLFERSTKPLPAPAAVVAACMYKKLLLLAVRRGPAAAMEPGYYAYDPDTGDCQLLQFEGATPPVPGAKLSFTAVGDSVFLNAGTSLHAISRKSGSWKCSAVPVAGMSTLAGSATNYALQNPVHGACTLLATTTGLYLLSLQGLDDVPTASYFYARKT
ncbi:MULTISPECIES: hypothetical protein [Delftia]|uniref:Uncharacterized protein n=1 Tax=Delftia lacustris TaxID=558537 RepID=A0A7T3DEY3_9BURK|nr:MULTISPECIES: hypothetical protein [Delftia]EPD46320.1 hypothetical protein HMPREF9702_00343 [Delftia acidovorans CCUG 15835]QPS80910.1 hypothetical protein I6G47_28715 [Delftia lacustris]